MRVRWSTPSGPGSSASSCARHRIWPGTSVRPAAPWRSGCPTTPSRWRSSSRPARSPCPARTGRGTRPRRPPWTRGCSSVHRSRSTSTAGRAARRGPRRSWISPQTRPGCSAPAPSTPTRCASWFRSWSPSNRVGAMADVFWGPDFAALQSEDPEIAAVVVDELDRLRGGLQLIASENFTSPAVLAALGSTLSNKYAEGYPGRRYYGGCEVVDRAEEIGIARAKELFGAAHANLQPHSGASANLAAYAALCEPDDTVLAMSLPHGGHLTHGTKVSFSGKWFNAVHYGVHPDTEDIDYDQMRDLAREHRPKMIICGGSAI